MVLGHEGLGIVEDVGWAAHRVQRGDRVALPAHIDCGVLQLCARRQRRVPAGCSQGMWAARARCPAWGRSAVRRRSCPPGAGRDRGDKRGVMSVNFVTPARMRQRCSSAA